MAFSNEKISTEDQAHINFKELTNPHGGRKLVGTPWWTIDRERNSYLIGLGGGVTREDYNIPLYFLFVIQGVRMNVEAFQRRSSSTDPMLAVLTWEVSKFQVPEKLSVPSEEVYIILADALRTYGNTGTEWSHVNLETVQVDLSKIIQRENVSGLHI